jgi:hypothetical protein
MVAHFSDSPVEREKARLGPMRDVLARHGVGRRYGKWRCPAPDHPDMHPSASVYVAADGDERVHCWSCGFDGDVIDVARALGEVVELRGGGAAPAPAVQRRPDALVRAFARAVAFRPEFAFEWEVTKLLALMPGYWARVEVAHNFEYLSARGDVSLMLHGAYLVRGVVIFRYCTAKSVDDPRSVTRAVHQALARVTT